ncbi:MAG TPA: T9SS type A sorting domain-containing protein [Puia sp.]|nr:T9SS type A sorting domain-containing protein [Puia sp.]
MKTIPIYSRLLKAALSTCLCSFFFLTPSFGQSETNNPITYDTTISEKANGEGPFTWQVRVTRQQNDNTLRPVIMTIPGSGETGTSPDNLVKYGPHFWLNNGWDGSVKLGNGSHYPILITLEQPAQNMRPWHLKAAVEILLKIFPIKPGSVHVGGLSQGSYEWGELIGFSAYAGDQTAMSEIRSWVDLEGVGPGDNFLGYDQAYPAVYGTWASKYGGRFFGLEGTQDSRNIWQISQAMNAAKANSAYFAYENIGGGGHCCWNSMYDPSVTNWQCVAPIKNANIVASSNPANTMGSYSVDPTTGTNIFQWMLRQGDTALAAGSVGTTPPSSPSSPPAVLTINSAQTITLPTNSVTISGTAMAQKGGASIHSVTWSQVSGPNTATIATPTTWSTSVTGMIAGAYTFQMTVTDNGGGIYTAKTNVTVNPATTTIAPILTIVGNQTITLPDSTVTLSGMASARVGGASIHSVTWSQVSGPNTATFSTPTSWSTSATGLVAGSYLFKMTVTDNGGGVYSSTTNVTVNATTSTSIVTGGYQVSAVDQNGAKSLTGATTEQLLVYPTVTSGALNLHIASNANGNVRIGIYDMNGRMVQEESTVKKDIYLDKTVPVNRLGSGMYVIQVVIGARKRMVTKFVKL